jgi:organic hydroperoxide reductase OsmC/OhrA
MSEHQVSIRWTRDDRPFEPDSYSRDHEWSFEGGQRVLGSAAPGYLGNPKGVNPEEALIAALSSCHMLTLLAIAAKKGLVIDRYDDEAEGTLGKNEAGQMALTHVVLRPRIEFAPGHGPDAEGLTRLNESAHRHCFISNSVKTTVTVEPR